MGLIDDAIERSVRLGRRVLEGKEVGGVGFGLLGSGDVVACLVSLGAGGGIVVLPLTIGRTTVGRNRFGCWGDEANALRGVVESSQWVVSCVAGHTTFRDASSTNGSVVVKRADCHLVPLTLSHLQDSTVGERLGWDGETQHRRAVRVETGDVVVNTYVAFVFVDGAASTDGG